MNQRIIVIEEDYTLCHSISKALEGEGHTVFMARDQAAANKAIEQQSFDLAILDLDMQMLDRQQFVQGFRAANPGALLVVLTSDRTGAETVDALRTGAADFVQKPVFVPDLVRTVQLVSGYKRLSLENHALRVTKLASLLPVETLKSVSGGLHVALEMVEKVAHTHSSVLLTGEKGGPYVALGRRIHDLSPRKSAPFFSFNCGTAPADEVEKILFGCESGEQEGDVIRESGLFRIASGGTVVLQGIEVLSSSAQTRLLEMLSKKEILPVGSRSPVKVDVRLIGASSAELNNLVEVGRFRKDLLYKLSVIEIQVPALRKRHADIAPLARHLVRYHSDQQNKSIEGITPRACEMLNHYSWPGNEEELAMMMERAVLIAEPSWIDLEELPLDLHAAMPHDVQSGDVGKNGDGAVSGNGEEELDWTRAMLAFEREHFAKVLAKTRGNREAAARMLGLSPATFYRHLQRVGLKGYKFVSNQTNG